MEKKRAYFKEAMKTMKTSGSIMPSSRFLAKKMFKSINFKDANIIVEYGAGNGVFTKGLLKRMNKNSKLICLEINPEFYKHLKEIKDERFVVLNESCENIKSICSQFNIDRVDYIVSSLPLSIIPDNVVETILKEGFEILNDEGVYIQYQYSTAYLKKLKKIYPKVKLDFELRNVPPAFIYNCKKK